MSDFDQLCEAILAAIRRSQEENSDAGNQQDRKEQPKLKQTIKSAYAE